MIRRLVSLGGNAILPASGVGTIEEQFRITTASMRPVVAFLARGEQLVVTHGNGPIVGNILIRNEAAKEKIPPMPLDICGADSQGGIGYMIQQVLANELRAAGLPKEVVTVITQVVVDRDDPGFQSPSKPIGPYYSKEDAERLVKERGWVVRMDANRGYRRLVPSPKPLDVVEEKTICDLIERGVVVIAAGGGGIPVTRDREGTLSGVEAVIDKDRASALLATRLGFSHFLIVTSVDSVARSYGKPEETPLARLDVAEARRLLAEGEFAPGSMAPKIEAAIDFLTAGGREVLITSPERLLEADAGSSGTRITP